MPPPRLPTWPRPRRSAVPPTWSGGGVVQATSVLGAGEVVVGAEAGGHGGRGAVDEQPAHAAVVDVPQPARPGAAGDVAVEVVHHGRQCSIVDVVARHRQHHHAHPARDVEPDPSGRDDAAGVDIGRRDASDAEAVTQVQVGHRERCAHDARQHRDVGDLAEGLVVVRQELLGCDDHARHAHRTGLRYFVARRCALYVPHTMSSPCRGLSSGIPDRRPYTDQPTGIAAIVTADRRRRVRV